MLDIHNLKEHALPYYTFPLRHMFLGSGVVVVG